MVAGHLREKGGIYYIVLSYTDEYGLYGRVRDKKDPVSVHGTARQGQQETGRGPVAAGSAGEGG